MSELKRVELYITDMVPIPESGHVKVGGIDQYNDYDSITMREEDVWTHYNVGDTIVYKRNFYNVPWELRSDSNFDGAALEAHVTRMLKQYYGKGEYHG